MRARERERKTRKPRNAYRARVGYHRSYTADRFTDAEIIDIFFYDRTFLVARAREKRDVAVQIRTNSVYVSILDLRKGRSFERTEHEL